MKIKEILEYGRNNLIGKEESYRLSKILLKYLLKVDDTYILINNEDISQSIVEKFKKCIKLLDNGIPIQYITKKQEFMKLDFYVDENVLIPQPDTEILVEEVLNIAKDHKKGKKILDLCTGSGAIGISIAKYIDDCDVTLSDISKEALKIAKNNAKYNMVTKNCNFIISDMFKSIEKKFDIIVSNPPYIKKDIIKQLSKEVQNEPILALDGGSDGLDFYKIIADNAYKYLNTNGVLALEIGYDQKENVINILKEKNKYMNIYSKKDLSGNDRIVVCNLK